VTGIAEPILSEFPELNDPQKEVVSHPEGPLLVVAGPGSGKTLVLVVRALNLLLQRLAKPEELLLCTFTEKAAFELRDRIAVAAKRLGYQGDLSSLRIGTIHSLANQFLLQYRHRTPLGHNYEVLDELTQLLFIFENFEEILGPEEQDGGYLGRWRGRWQAIKGARDYFNKITEELIDPPAFLTDGDPFIQALGRSYQHYEELLLEKNHLDFPHQQKLFYQLLNDPELGPAIGRGIRYVMVDEYQDTNYIQEQILLKLATPEDNIVAVGDEDQSLYRFRGATVRNILEFPQQFDSCKIVKLTINYRSHERIVQDYNKFIAGCDWSNRDGRPPFRYEKEILPDPTVNFPDYPAVFAIWGENRRDEATRLAEFVQFLKESRVIEDYSQVALLLHSVRLEHSGHYLQALEERGIPAFAPRARGYFESEEVRLMIACFALLLGYHGEGRGERSVAIACGPLPAISMRASLRWLKLPLTSIRSLERSGSSSPRLRTSARARRSTGDWQIIPIASSATSPSPPF